MSEWNEEVLRKAASWKAFKEGKMLCESGAVSGAKAGSSGWQGAVREGKRVFRVSVKVNSATDLETRCACPENQATGALCAHGVAAGLAALRPAGVKEAPEAKEEVIAAKAWQVVLPPNWRAMAERGRLVGAVQAVEGEATAPDETLGQWWADEARRAKLPLQFHLEGEGLDRFLRAAAGHPKVRSGEVDLEIAEGGRVAVSRLGRERNGVRLAGEGEGLVRLGDGWWRVAEGGLRRIGSGRMPAGAGRVLEAMAGGREAEVEMSRFLGALEEWQEWMVFPEDSWLGGLHFVPAAGEMELTLEGSLEMLEARPRVRYGSGREAVPGEGTVEGLPILEGECCRVRDFEGERRLIESLGRAGFVAEPGGSWVLKGEKRVLELMAGVLPEWEAKWKVGFGRQFQTAKRQVAVVSPKLEILGSGEDWLSFDFGFETNDGSIISLHEIKRLLKSGRGSSGKRVVLSQEVESLVEPLFEEIDLRQEGGHFVAAARSGELIREIRKKIHKTIDHDKNRELFTRNHPATLKAVMRSYQTYGYGWMLDRVERFGGAVLADDMGLGKTVQTIACIESLMNVEGLSGVVLVVATASLLGNWKAEFGKFAPARRVRVLHGSGRDSEREKVADGEVVLTSFGTLSRDLAWHLKREYQAVVVDEASLMRNPDTDHAKAISKLRARGRIALTGTPVENGVRDLWSIFRFVQPGWLGSREEFRERYEVPLLGGESKRVMERLRLKVSPFLLRRTKSEVAPELPSKIVIDEWCDLSGDQQAVYRDLLVEGRKRVEVSLDGGNAAAARMQVLTALLRLRQTCCDLALVAKERFERMPVGRRSVKMERLLELLGEAVSGGHRVLVFSQFQTQLREIEKCVAERGWESLRLDGQTRNRQQLVDRFQQEGGPPVFLISLKAGGYGLNLTAADVVVHFDPWWNPAAEAQATDRAHRIGQTRPVTVYRLLTRGTVEEKVVKLQAKKRRLAEVIDESGGGDAAGWSEAELREVLG